MSKEIQYLVSKGKRYRCLTRAAALEWLSAAVSWGTKENHPIVYPQVLAADALDALSLQASPLLGVTMETGEPYPFMTAGGNFTFIANPAHGEVIPVESKYVPYELNKGEVQDFILGKVYIRKPDKTRTLKVIATEIKHDPKCDIGYQWYIDGMTAETFLQCCTWTDGTPCGEKTK